MEGSVQTAFKAMKARAISTYPEFVQELNGTAYAAGQSLDLVLLANFRQEIEMARDSVDANGGVDHCTDVFTDTAFAHNEDGGIEDFDTIYFVRLRTYAANGATVDEFAGITYAGRLPGWGPGWNNHGLAWTSNVLYAKPLAPLLDGLSVIFLARDMARASSIEDAIARGTPKGLLMAGQNLNIASFPDRRIVTVETAPGGTWNKLEVTKEESPTFHANEYLRMKNVPQDEANPHLFSARHRHATFLRTSPPKDKADLLHFLGDTSDPIFPVFRRNDTTQEFTLVTVAFDVKRGTAEFYRASPRLGEKALLWREWIFPGKVEPQIIIM